MKHSIWVVEIVIVLITFIGLITPTPATDSTTKTKSFTTKSNCRCSDVSLCKPIQGNSKEQVFIFSVNKSNFKEYDWTKITTAAVTYSADIDPVLVCYAHSYNARVVSMANFPVKNLTNAKYFQPWIDEQIKHVEEKLLDGINVDFESVIERNDNITRDGLTKLIQMLAKQLKQHNQFYQVSFDFAWTPNCIDTDSRCYDYVQLANAVDYAFIMSYDERSQIHGPCVAWANSAYNTTKTGIQQFLDLGISPDRLILGVPWYGYRYPCLKYDEKTRLCTIEKVAFRGVQCSDAAGRQISYSTIMSDDVIGQTMSGRDWDEQAQSPYFAYKATDGTIYQVWYDDPKSLRIKYQLAQLAALAGVGMWEADDVDYANKTQVADMWGALPKTRAGL